MVHNLSNSCNWADMQVGTRLDNQLGLEVVVIKVGLKLLMLDYLRAEKLMAVYYHSVCYCYDLEPPLTWLKVYNCAFEQCKSQ